MLLAFDIFDLGSGFWIQKTPESGSETLHDSIIKKCKINSPDMINFYQINSVMQKN